MELIEHRDERGRLYKAYQDGDTILIVAPNEDLLDDLGLPESFATRLHNILYRRGILTYTDAAKRPQELMGALQELYQLDAQKLMEILFRYEHQEVDHD
jgi:hypothetical protein